MEPAAFTSDRFGGLQTRPLSSWTHPYFMPARLPRELPLPPSVGLAVSRADISLGRLSGLGQLVQDPELLLGPSMAQEALSSSRIEGTQASLSDVLSAESGGAPIVDENLREVDNYLRAAREGNALLGSLPVTQRLFCATHATLMSDVRGEEKAPGELRRSPVWIGSPNASPESARFIPPHQDHIPELLADWESFVNEDSGTVPVVVKCALMHYQFETIHPFLDGNGRIGRLLIGLMLVNDGVLPAPILHISGFFERHRVEYYERLQAVRERGEIEEWIRFFADGVTEQATESASRITLLVQTRERYRAEVRADRSALAGLVDVIFRNPVVTVGSVQRALDVSQPTASTVLRKAQERGWLVSMGRWGQGGKERWLAREIWDVVHDEV